MVQASNKITEKRLELYGHVRSVLNVDMYQGKEEEGGQHYKGERCV